MKNDANPSAANAEEYIAQQAPEYREQLENLRSLIQTLVPDAAELISYGVICYKKHYMLVGIGVAQNFCSLYTMSPGLVKTMNPELKPVKISGATLHFALGEPLPEDIIQKVVAARLEEDHLRWEAKKKK